MPHSRQKAAVSRFSAVQLGQITGARSLNHDGPTDEPSTSSCHVCPGRRRCEGPAQVFSGVGAGTPAEFGLPTECGHIKSVGATGIDVEFRWHTRLQQPLGVVDVLAEKEVEAADKDVSRRQVREVGGT